MKDIIRKEDYIGSNASDLINYLNKTAAGKANRRVKSRAIRHR